jgi:ankyrin repeat protein
MRHLSAVLSVALLPICATAWAQSPGNNEVRLVVAVQNGDQKMVRSLLEARVDVNEPAGDGSTALAWAVHRDDAETTELLLRAGANVNAANDYGVAPLALACLNRNSAIVDKLLNSGANPNAPETTGETPLMTCSRTGAADAVKSLLMHRAEPNAKESRRGQTALMWAAAGKYPDVTKLLLEHGADIRARTKTGFTPLMFAAQSGDLESARILLVAGADINESAPEYGNALVVASASSHEDLAIYLLEKGANPNVADKHGITPLHNAAQKGLSTLTRLRYDPSYRVQPSNMPRLAKALLAKGANPNARIKDQDDRGPSDIQFNMRGATPFFLAAVSGDAELMRLLWASGADANLTGGSDTTALMAAAGSTCAGPCAFEGGSGGNHDPDKQEENKALEAVKVAVEAGAKIDAVNRDRQTAMHFAAFTGVDSVVQFLADHGAKIDLKDKSGQTPWSMAIGLSPALRERGRYGHHESTANLLLKLGAKPITQQDFNSEELAPN